MTSFNDIRNTAALIRRRLAIRGHWTMVAAGLTCAVLASACETLPDDYYDGAGHEYCSTFLKFAQRCAGATTATYLICLCLTVILGFLAAQLNNDTNGATILQRHRSSFLFVTAAVAGIFAAYFHSRADAASKAAAEVTQAMASIRDVKKYKLCLAAVSRWHDSRADSIAAASAMATDPSTAGTKKLAEAVESSSNARESALSATKDVTESVQAILTALKEPQPRARGPETSARLSNAQQRLNKAVEALGSASKASEEASKRVMLAKETIESDPSVVPTSPATPDQPKVGRTDAGVR